MVDKVIQGKTRIRHKYCSFYTESDPILTYMVTRLDVSDGDLILEPCAGDGIFIEKIYTVTENKTFKVEAVDLNPKAVEQLKEKFKEQNIEIRETDTLLDPMFDWFANSGGQYSKIIGNPPYGAWQDYDKRSFLKKRYGGYVKETYTLFLRRCIDLLRNNGRLTFIIPDTFLALHLHSDTRKKILRETKIEEILLIPSNFFPGVNFGYSNLCIISFVKDRNTKNNKIKIVTVNNSIDDLYKIATGDYSVADYFEEIPQQEIIDSVDYSFFIGGNPRIRKLINESTSKLGDIADCVTGFYSGDNKTFLAVKDQTVRGSKGYEQVDTKLMVDKFCEIENLVDGLGNGKRYIPILKGGHSPLIKETEWFVKWDKETVEFYKKDKAARFQNSHFYFREGIGVPMVKSSRINAFLLDCRLFDQSIVGIFPRDPKHLYYLLAFLNSEVCTRLLKVINHTANNSANYLKKLPIITNSESVKEIDGILDNFLKWKNTLQETIGEINRVFQNLYHL